MDFTFSLLKDNWIRLPISEIKVNTEFQRHAVLVLNRSPILSVFFFREMEDDECQTLVHTQKAPTPSLFLKIRPKIGQCPGTRRWFTDGKQKKSQRATTSQESSATHLLTTAKKEILQRKRPPTNSVKLHREPGGTQFLPPTM